MLLFTYGSDAETGLGTALEKRQALNLWGFEPSHFRLTSGSMVKTRFKFIVTDDQQQFSRDVTLLLDEGWDLFGSSRMTFSPSGAPWYYQTMIRDEETEERAEDHWKNFVI